MNGLVWFWDDRAEVRVYPETARLFGDLRAVRLDGAGAARRLEGPQAGRRLDGRLEPRRLTGETREP